MKEDEALLLITKTFNEKPGSIGLDTLKDDIPNWDSIGTISLMAELDEQFGVLWRKRKFGPSTALGTFSMSSETAANSSISNCAVS